MNLKAIAIAAVLIISLLSGCVSAPPTTTVTPTAQPTIDWAITTPTPVEPTVTITPTPTQAPTPTPTPTQAPTLNPTATQSPTIRPTEQPTVQPTVQPISTTYIGNSNTKKFHKTDCRYVGTISDANRVTLSSRDEAISKGYQPCKVCNP